MKKYLLLLIGLCFFFAPKAHAAITLVATSTVTKAASAATVTSTLNVVSGDLVVVMCGNTNFETSTVTDTIGNSWSIATSTVNAADGPSGSMSYAVSSASNASDILTCTIHSATTHTGIAAHEYSGAAASSPLDVVVSVVTTTAITVVTSPPFTTTNAGDVVVSVDVGSTGGTSYTAGAPSILRTANLTLGTENWIPGTILTNATTSMTQTGTSGFPSYITAAFLPAASGPTNASPANSKTMASIVGILQVSNSTLSVANESLLVQ